MADSPPPPPPASTTITALGDDLLREIFLRLPDVTSLARAAFSCRAFLGAVRYSPAFRRRFRQLRAPPLLALFLQPHMCAIVPADAGKGSGIRGFAGLLQDSDASEWRAHLQVPYSGGCANFVNRATDQLACYSPHSQALKIFHKNFHDGNDEDGFLEFHTLCPDGEEQRPSRVVCVHRDRAWAWARVAVFSSHTMEWQVVLPEMQTGPPLPAESDRCAAVTVAGGFVCWVHNGDGCIFMLDTATFQLSRMDLPRPPSIELFQLGQTKDGELCLVGVLKFMLFVWLWAADDDGVGRFMLQKMFSLRANVSKVTECAEEADVLMRSMVVINGFVYLFVTYRRNPQSPQWFLSFCLETEEMNVLHKERQRCVADPYLMVSWPSSLINGKEDSETGVTGNISEDDGPIGTEEASPVLFTALQSFKEKLIDNGNLNFAEIDSFLIDDERNSLLNRIATLESGLAVARDRVLGIRTEPNSMNGMEVVTLESELGAATVRFLRIGTTGSDSMEGSCWQMCKGMFGRACSRFCTG